MTATLTPRRRRSFKPVDIRVACCICGSWAALKHGFQLLTPYEDYPVVALPRAGDIDTPPKWLQKRPLLSDVCPWFQLYLYPISGN
jgi:hypothetical protein